MCTTPSPTQHCSGFSTWPRTSLTTTWWVYETCFSRWKWPRSEKKNCPASANVRICASVSRLLGSSLVWDRRSITMPDYYTSQQLAQTLGIGEAAIAELQTKELLQPAVKDGRSFFSSRQAHCLRAAIRWARK